MRNSNRNFVKKKKNTPTRESSKIISRPGSTTNPRNVKALKSSIKKTGVKTVTPKSKVSVAKKANVAKKVSKVAKKVSTTRAKGVAALASGNKAKALRMKKKEIRQTKKATRKAKRNK